MSGLIFEEALVQGLKTVSALENRVYPLASPEANAKSGVPYVIYVSSEGMRTKTLDGYQADKSVQGEINVVTRRYEDMKSITTDVINVLVGFEGRSIGTDGPFIQELTYESPVELYEDQPKLYRCLIDFEVYF